MLRIRLIEEAIAENYSDQEMRCPVHLSIGQEATAVGVCSILKNKDWVLSGHRSHAHYLAKGGDLNKMIAEIYGKQNGCCGGLGGSMHLTDLQSGFLASTPIVGSTIPIAVGAAYKSKLSGYNSTVVIFFGDGAMETGVLHESMNFASLKKLPIIFVCENNLYSVYSPINVRQPEGRGLAKIAEAHDIKSFYADGNNVLDVYDKSLSCLNYILEEGAPCFLELPTYRWREHCGPNFDNTIGYRKEEEFLNWKKKDPLILLENEITKSNIELFTKKIDTEVNNAFNYAINSPFPKSIQNQEVYA